MPETYQIPLNEIATPRLDEYFGVWAILEEPFRQACRSVETINLRDHILQAGETRLEKLEARHETQRVNADGGPAQNVTAVISLRGPLMKQSSSLSGGTSTVAARQAIREAANDPAVTAILLNIDSPGGAAAGTAELADEVRSAAKKKTTWAYIEDLGASAAYWVASQASRVITNPTGMVGSIGTFMVMHDLSAMAEKEGVKVHVIRAGEFKGAGTPGTVVTDAQIEHYQGIVNSLNEHFLRAVADGRSMPLKQVRELADGRVHIGDAAKSLGLVDAVDSFEATLAALSKERKGQQTMTDANPAGSPNPAQPQPATYTELVSGCGGLDPQQGEDAKFLTSQLATGATLPQAQQAWMTLQKQRADAAQKELAELKAAQSAGKPAAPAAAAPAQNRPGVDPITSTKPASEGDLDPQAAVEELVTAEMARTGKPRSQAFQQVMRKNPALRQQLVAAANS